MTIKVYKSAMTWLWKYVKGLLNDCTGIQKDYKMTIKVYKSAITWLWKYVKGLLNEYKDMQKDYKMTVHNNILHIQLKTIMKAIHINITSRHFHHYTHMYNI